MEVFNDEDFHLFQFHTGSIRSNTCIGELLTHPKSFNSTLDQLEVLFHTISIAVLFSFNSTLDQLEDAKVVTVWLDAWIVSIPHWIN